MATNSGKIRTPEEAGMSTLSVLSVLSIYQFHNPVVRHLSPPFTPHFMRFYDTDFIVFHE